MTNHVLLNNVDHKDLRVITRYSAEFGDNTHAVVTFPTEFGDIQREYPILFRKDGESGEFQSVALLGFASDENLFLQDGRWTASYVPGVIARGPFLIGFQEQDVGGELRREPVIHVDRDNPRVSTTEGEPVFLEHGGNAPYLERIADVLRGIHDGMAVSETMFSAFRCYDLIEPVDIDIDVHEDEQYKLQGFSTISRDKLSQLDGAALEKLNKAGFLEGAFLVLASLHNIKKLIDIKKSRARVR